MICRTRVVHGFRISLEDMGDQIFDGNDANQDNYEPWVQKIKKFKRQTETVRRKVFSLSIIHSQFSIIYNTHHSIATHS